MAKITYEELRAGYEAAVKSSEATPEFVVLPMSMVEKIYGTEVADKIRSGKEVHLEDIWDRMYADIKL